MRPVLISQPPMSSSNITIVTKSNNACSASATTQGAAVKLPAYAIVVPTTRSDVSRSALGARRTLVKPSML